MGNRLIACLLGFFGSAAVALGQAPESKLLPMPQVKKPALEATSVESHHVPIESISTSFAQVSFEANYLLSIFPNQRDRFRVATTSRPTSFPLGTLGDEQLNARLFAGGEFALGYWWMEKDPIPGPYLRTAGAELRFFFLPERSGGFSDRHSPDIVRPFFDLNNRALSEVIVASPGLATGEINAIARASLWGAEANVWQNVFREGIPFPSYSCDLMAGFRYLDLDQSIEINGDTHYFANVSAFPAFLAFAGNRIQETDSFTTHNRFYGGQIGVAGNLFIGDLVVTGMLKLALGATSQDLDISGQQTRTLANGTTQTATGALLALPSNIGQHSKTRFSQVPEIGLKFSYYLFHNLSFKLGASGLYWNRMIRPGDQIDRDIDITQIPNFPPGATATPTGLNRPGVLFNQSSLWVVNVTLGMEFSW